MCVCVKTRAIRAAGANATAAAGACRNSVGFHEIYAAAGWAIIILSAVGPLWKSCGWSRMEFRSPGGTHTQQLCRGPSENAEDPTTTINFPILLFD